MHVVVDDTFKIFQRIFTTRMACKSDHFKSATVNQQNEEQNMKCSSYSTWLQSFRWFINDERSMPESHHDLHYGDKETM